MNLEQRNNISRVRAFSQLLLVGFAFSLLVPSYAFAEEASGIEAILPDMTEFIPMLAAFIIVAAILAKFGWPQFSGMIDKREQTIRESLEKSEQARLEAEATLAEYKKELDEAKLQASHIVAQAKQTAEALQADMTKKAQAESERMIAQAHLAIEADKKAALADLQASMADVSIAVASKIIAQDLSDAEHRTLIERYVQEVGSFNDR